MGSNVFKNNLQRAEINKKINKQERLVSLLSVLPLLSHLLSWSQGGLLG